MSNVAKSAHNRKDLSGRVFGKLTVIEYSHTDKRCYWKCRCSCGSITIGCSKRLINGQKKSCACIPTGRSLHGESHKTKEYRTWASMKNRCLNPKNKRFTQYGGAGITVCGEWINSFETFLLDMGRAPSPKHSIERIHNDIGYSASNCRWATNEEQCNNKKFCIHVNINGKQKTVAQWCRDFGISRFKIYNKIKRGASPYEAITSITQT